MIKGSPELSENPIVLPFLKWAGGKRWLVAQHPELFSRKFERYVEPFVGSGAVYFYLQPRKALLADINSELIDSYRAIKKDREAVWNILKKYQNQHNPEFYYKIRSKSFSDLPKRAARFIYLNRTCWNGLYRVNRQGIFNVPIGTKTTVTRETDNFDQVSKLLKGTRLHVWNFVKTIEASEKGDFLFIDPPYTVKHNLNGFVKYNDKLFSWEDQEKLCNVIKKAKKRGVNMLITNANHESVRKLYSGLGESFVLKRASVISGKVSGRGQYTELVIRL